MKILLNNIEIPIQFREVTVDVDDLAESMDKVGQLQPVGVTHDKILVFGYRRYLAAKKLGWDSLEAIKLPPLWLLPALLTTLEENITRSNYHWSELVMLRSEIHYIISLQNSNLFEKGLELKKENLNLSWKDVSEKLHSKESIRTSADTMRISHETLARELRGRKLIDVDETLILKSSLNSILKSGTVNNLDSLEKSLRSLIKKYGIDEVAKTVDRLYREAQDS